MEVRAACPVPPELPPPVTTMLEVAVTRPNSPVALAVMVVVPALFAVTNPLAFTVATAVLEEVHFAEVVMFIVTGA